MNDKEIKKSIFEPISAEEAKKIKAYKEDINPTSATFCTSGEDRRWTACDSQMINDDCCWDDGQSHYGRCEESIYNGATRLYCANFKSSDTDKL